MPSASLDIKLHSTRECACYDTTVTDRCSYQAFPDGWDFTHDVGHGQVRGEVFTPLHLVESMIQKSGLLPASAFAGDYLGLSDDSMKEIVEARVFEPAVGTGNFIATILWHKLNYAVQLASSGSSDEVALLDVEYLEELFLKALASCYMNDIDAGNLETVKRRLLTKDSPFGGFEDVRFWESHVLDTLENQDVDPEALISGSKDDLENKINSQVRDSLKAAVELWSNDVTSGGIVNKVYKQATGHDLDNSISEIFQSILDNNVKLFSSLNSKPSVQYGLIMPGWEGLNFTRVKDIVDVRTYQFDEIDDLPAWKASK